MSGSPRTPRVSVLVTSYNREDTIDTHAQTFLLGRLSWRELIEEGLQ